MLHLTLGSKRLIISYYKNYYVRSTFLVIRTLGGTNSALFLASHDISFSPRKSGYMLAQYLCRT